MTRKTAFFEGWSWFKFNKLRLALDMGLKFYTSVAKGSKLKVRRFCGLIPTFVEVTGEKLVGGFFGPPILNRVNIIICMIVPLKGENVSWEKSFSFIMLQVAKLAFGRRSEIYPKWSEVKHACNIKEIHAGVSFTLDICNLSPSLLHFI